MTPTHTPAVSAFLSIKTQFDNLGDVLINRELCLLVADRAETFVDFSRAPAAFEASMNIHAHPNVTTLRKQGFARLLMIMVRSRASGRTCYLFLNPGGLGGGSLPLKARLSALVYNLLLGCLRLIGVRICHVGISYDAMPVPERFIARWRRRLMHSFTVRDQFSFDYVRRIGMAADQIVPDLSFNLYRRSLLHASQRSAIALSFRFDGKADACAIEQAVLGIVDTLGTECEYLFIVQVARDEVGMRCLQAACDKTGVQTRLLICHEDIDALSATYLTCRAIYSNRLHALLLAAHAGASPYALVSKGAQPKIEGMFHDLGMPERLVFVDGPALALPTIEPVNIELLLSKFETLRFYFDALLRVSWPCDASTPTPIKQKQTRP